MTAAIARSTILFFIVIICGRTEQNRPDLAGYVKHLYRKIELHRRSPLKKASEKESIVTKKWTWEMIADTLIKEFQNDKYTKGEKMPSENKMAVRFQVPRIAENGRRLTSVYDYIHSCGYTHLRTDNAQLTVSSLSKKERTLLGVKGYAPCLVLTCKCVTDPAGTVVEVARTIYRSDKFIFQL